MLNFLDFYFDQYTINIKADHIDESDEATWQKQSTSSYGQIINKMK